ncbi:cysteine hydrolase family protein [Leeia sp.]|uniref:cysteine hydrolase family protein n=1 Tax=Leeia sp. TaxID=2884678 RepID=UPI0035B4DB39
MKTALLVIDMQQGLFSTPPFELAQVIERINQLTTAARAAGQPVIWIMHEKPESPLAYQSPGWQLQPGLLREPSDREVRKTTPDSFLRTELQALLDAEQVKQLVICGYACEFCVDTTVRQAAARGYPVSLVADAHTTHDKPHATAAAIRAHENATLPNISSFGPRIQALNSADIRFNTAL